MLFNYATLSILGVVFVIHLKFGFEINTDPQHCCNYCKLKTVKKYTTLK